ncbi:MULTISPECIES: DUF6461 domain-containing protein [unclassified Streptomyces]|uniref:DUF6461 domain-containing protein n=1 Tax=unclassified Streptomyces TaxID=2593676 RepID=UPI00362AA1B5
MSVDIFPNSQLYETGYCVLFAKNISATEILARITDDQIAPIPLSRLEAEAVKARGQDVEEDDIPGLDLDELRDSGVFDDSGPLLRSGTHGNWSFIIESEGSYLAGEEQLEAVSRGTVAFSAQVSETSSTWISYAEDQEILSSFDPLFPEQDYGKRTEVLDALTGYREVIENGERSEAYENALRVIQRELRCVVPAEADAGRLLAIRIAGVY